MKKSFLNYIFLVVLTITYGCVKNSVSKPELLLPVTDIDKNSNSVTLTSSVKSEGSAATIERGFCISKSPNPSVSDIKISVGYGPGEFKYVVSNLDLGTTYYLKSYATNSVGTSYSNEVFFNTLNGVKFSESKFEQIDGETVKITFNVLDFGDAIIKNVGLIYSYKPNVQFNLDSNNVIYKNIIDKVGSFELKNLKFGKQVHYKIYVQSGAGLFLSKEESFTTADFPVLGQSTIYFLPNNIYNIETEIINTGGSDIKVGGYFITQLFPFSLTPFESTVNATSITNSKMSYQFSNLPNKTTFIIFPFVYNKYLSSLPNYKKEFTTN